MEEIAGGDFVAYLDRFATSRYTVDETTVHLVVPAEVFKHYVTVLLFVLELGVNQDVTALGLNIRNEWQDVLEEWFEQLEEEIQVVIRLRHNKMMSIDMTGTLTNSDRHVGLQILWQDKINSADFDRLRLERAVDFLSLLLE
jgi:hypothetical protein